jgi:hypothetical protein
VLDEVVEVGLLCDCVAACDHPCIMITIGEFKFCAIVDIGAEVSIASRQTLEYCKQQLCSPIDYTQQLHIRGFTGCFASMNFVADLKLMLPGEMWSKTHSFAIVEDSIIPSCFLLGADILISHELSINGATDQCVQGCSDNGVDFLECTRKCSRSCQTPPSLLVTGLTARNGVHDIGCTVTPLTDKFAIIGMQKHDLQLSLLKQLIIDETPIALWPVECERFKSSQASLFVHEDVLWYKGLHTVIVVTFNMLVQLSVQAHNDMAHVGR